MKTLSRKTLSFGLLALTAAALALPVAAAEGTANPCAAKAANPCAANPCAAKAKNPCAPVNQKANKKAANPCAAKN